MAFVLDDIVAAVGAAKAAAEAMQGITETIRGGFRGNAEEKKKQLADEVGNLKTALQNVRTLAGVGEAYVQSHEDILHLLFLCRRAERVLTDSVDACRDKDHPGYEAAWRVLDTLFDAMDRDIVKRVNYGRQDWYDVKDKVQIETWLADFDKADTRRETNIRIRAADELRHDVSDMRLALERTESLLQGTLYNKILKALRGVGT